MSEKMEQSPLAMEVLQQFRVIFGSMRQYFRLVEDRCGMPASQLWALQEVRQRPGTGVGELARLLGIHQSTCSLIVDKLVTAGLLAKEQQGADLRRVGLTLTGQGEAALGNLPGPAEGVLPVALSSLPTVALKTLNINLDELIQALLAKDEYFRGIPLADIDSNGRGREC